MKDQRTKVSTMSLRLSQIESEIRELCDEIPYGDDSRIDGLRQYVWNASDTEQKIALEGYQE